MRALLTKSTTLTLTLLLAAGAASAQTGSLADRFSGDTPYVPFSPPAYPPTSPVPTINHSSTVHEGFFRGIASGIQSVANLSVQLAQSRILNEQAYAMNRQNRVINTQTFYAREQIKTEARRERLEAQWIWDGLMKERQENRKRELAVTAYRLPRSMFNSETGEIAWPEMFSRPELASLRNKLDKLFADLAAEGPQHDYLYRDPIAKVCQELLAAVRDQRATFGDDLSGYWDAINLVSRLEFTAKNWSNGGYDTAGQGYDSQVASL